MITTESDRKQEDAASTINQSINQSITEIKSRHYCLLIDVKKAREYWSISHNFSQYYYFTMRCDKRI